MKKQENEREKNIVTHKCWVPLTLQYLSVEDDRSVK